MAPAQAGSFMEAPGGRNRANKARAIAQDNGWALQHSFGCWALGVCGKFSGQSHLAWKAILTRKLLAGIPVTLLFWTMHYAEARTQPYEFRIRTSVFRRSCRRLGH